MKKNAFFSFFSIPLLLLGALCFFCTAPEDPDTAKPKNLSYDSTKYIIYIEEPIPEITPEYIGEVDSFTISPMLPDGMFFNKETGVISGIAKDTLSGSFFTVTADNKNGSDSTEIFFIVNAPPILIVEPEDVAVFKGESAHFSVVATGVEPLTYRWIRDNSEIEDADSTLLSIDEVRKADTGTYRCIVTDANGRTTESDSARCIISTDTTPPVITVPPSTRSAVIGEAVVLTVTAKGSNVSFQWRKNAKDITDAEQSFFLIDSFSVNDTGTYQVIVTNRFGSDTSPEAHLIIGDTTSVIREVEVTIEGNGRIRYDNRFYSTDTLLSLLNSATATMHFLPDSGYFIRNIAVNDTTDSAAIVNSSLLFEEIADDCSVAVIFDTVPSDFLLPDSFSLTVTVRDTSTGSVTVEPVMDKYEEGDTVTITAVPKIGFVFIEWDDSDEETTNPLTVIITKNDTLEAIFEPDPEVEEWSVSPGVSLNTIIAEVSGSPIPGAIIKPKPGEYDDNTIIIEGNVEIEIRRGAP